ncbi:MAG: peptidyl-prolyl cis-trans isomerase [Chthoniobacterales bacterium]|nr:peptidyl-prolyl cis-trans isomerase [Chthoniobacterales bacterium]
MAFNKATLSLCRHPAIGFIASVFLAVAAAASPTHGAESVNGIAAIVNNDVITYSEVRQLVEPRERLLRSQYSGDELAKKIIALRKSALQDLIDRQLIIQQFDKDKLDIPGFFVDERVKDVIRDSFGGDRNAFIKTMEAQNYSISKFKTLEREKIIVQAMRSKNVKSNLLVPPSKVDEYYRQHRELFATKAQVKLRMIMIPGKADAGADDPQKTMAEEIRGKLITGADFDKMAQMYSEDSTRDLGGDWGWVDDKTLSAPLTEVAFKLKPGEISKIVSLANNYYILKVEARQGGDLKPLKGVRADIESRLRQEQAQQLQEHWIASLRSKAFIKTF